MYGRTKKEQELDIGGVHSLSPPRSHGTLAPNPLQPAQSWASQPSPSLLQRSFSRCPVVCLFFPCRVFIRKRHWMLQVNIDLVEGRELFKNVMYADEVTLWGSQHSILQDRRSRETPRAKEQRTAEKRKNGKIGCR